MGNARNSKTHLRDPQFSKDFGKKVLDALFHGWYKICYYHPDATQKQRLMKRLSVINKEILYLSDQLDEKSSKSPRSDDKRTVREKFSDLQELDRRKQKIIERLRNINREEKKRRPNHE